MRSHLHSRSDSEYVLAMDSLASAVEHRGPAFGKLKLSKVNPLLRAAFCGKAANCSLNDLAVAGNLLACI